MVDSIVADRYQIIKQLSDKLNTKTYLVEDNQVNTAHKQDVYSTYSILKQIQLDNHTVLSFEEAKQIVDYEIEKLQKLASIPQISHLLDHFTRENSFYLVQEFKEGISLQEKLINEEIWRETDVIQFLHESLNILNLIHKEGIIHQDIKPANLIFTKEKNELVLVDFGKFNQLEGDLQATIPIENKAYFAPELLRGKPKPASDIYALGIIAIQALTGLNSDEFDEDNEGKIIWEKELEINDKLKVIINKMIAHELTKRYNSAQEVLDDLITLLPENLVSVSHPSKGEYTPTEIIEGESEPESNLPNTEMVISSEEENKSEISPLNDTEIVESSPAEIIDPWIENDDQNEQNESLIEENKNNNSEENYSVSQPYEEVTKLGEISEEVKQESSPSNSNSNASNKDPIIPKTTVVLDVNNNKKSSRKIKQKLAFNILKRNQLFLGLGLGGLFLVIILAIAFVSYLKEKRKETFMQKIESYIENKEYQSCINQTNSKESQTIELSAETLPNYRGECTLSLAQLEAANRNFPEAIAIANKIDSSNPFYKKAQNRVNSWSKAILAIAKQTYQRGDLEKAMEILDDIPQSSSVKEEALDLEREWKQEQNRELIKEQPLGICPGPLCPEN